MKMQYHCYVLAATSINQSRVSQQYTLGRQTGGTFWTCRDQKSGEPNEAELWGLIVLKQAI